jgi:deoxycytidylate deaminase
MTSDRGNTGGAELTTPVPAEYLVSWENGAVLQYEVCNKKVYLKSEIYCFENPCHTLCKGIYKILTMKKKKILKGTSPRNSLKQPYQPT